MIPLPIDCCPTIDSSYYTSSMWLKPSFQYDSLVNSFLLTDLRTVKPGCVIRHESYFLPLCHFPLLVLSWLMKTLLTQPPRRSSEPSSTNLDFWDIWSHHFDVSSILISSQFRFYLNSSNSVSLSVLWSFNLALISNDHCCHDFFFYSLKLFFFK